MKHVYLQNFRSLDSEAFAALMRHQGFASSACFKLSGGTMALVLRSEDGGPTESPTQWPAAVRCSSNYTSAEGGTVPLGWVRLAAAGTDRKAWPKGVILYFPEQELSAEKVVFGVINPPGKRTRDGELSGALEAAGSRVRGWFRDQAERAAVSEAGLAEHMRRLGTDMRMLLDHELRTPMASVAGYAQLLRELDPREQPELWRDYLGVLEHEAGNMLTAIDKLSLALHAERGEPAARDMETFDAAADMKLMCDRLQLGAAELVGELAGARARVKYQKATDQSCSLLADRSLFAWALWEVLKNALAHSRSGRVNVNVYTAGGSLVIDVEDDGSGVSAGSEELIFLRFYQDPGTQHLRRGKRGLGLGLFLARHIVERHLGRLTFLRQKSGSLFRFIWPLPADSSTDTPGAEVLILPRGA